ncbi:MAG: phosphoribosylamine--glycine ligase, partial [Sphingomonas bacterium]|nr:phosphoribosylamine--glycine ligase [Sphingomonas bacterium]
LSDKFRAGYDASGFAWGAGARGGGRARALYQTRGGARDTGPNTGGMGAYSPAPVLTPELEVQAMREIVEPTARAMAAAGTPFSGILFAGLMLTADGPKLIEYNVRFGDPECEAIMPRIDGDFAALLNAVATGAAIASPILKEQSTMTVIVAADGYPGTPKKHGPIDGIEAAEREHGVTVFHAGTAQHGERLVASGGRILAVTAIADTLANARARAYRAIDAIDYADGFHRRDIGWRELERQA